MKIFQAEYTISAVSPKQYPEALEPEIALVGRSNVGKSSLINKIINRKNLARTSSQPGKTRTLNFYHINEAWYFVDFPGYGFAKVSKEIKSQWGKFIDQYLHEREQLVGIIQIVDMRHPPSADDLMMHQWLESIGVPYMVVVTKADKISKGQRFNNMKIIKNDLKIHPGVPMITFSAQTGEGKDDVEAWVEKLV